MRTTIHPESLPRYTYPFPHTQNYPRTKKTVAWPAQRGSRSTVKSVHPRTGSLAHHKVTSSIPRDSA